MKTNPWLLLLGISLTSAFPMQVRADLDVAISAEIRLGKVPPPPPPVVEVVEEVGPKGPPPWAPAHGFRRNRGYYFYPGANVYYRPDDRMWFFLEGSEWRVGVQLPSSIRVDFGRSVSLTMETDKPYVHHAQVVVYYPGDYFKRVKIKEPKDKERGKSKHEEAEKAATGGSDNSDKADHPGHGAGHSSGKGKGKNK